MRLSALALNVGRLFQTALRPLLFKFTIIDRVSEWERERERLRRRRHGCQGRLRFSCTWFRTSCFYSQRSQTLLVKLRSGDQPCRERVGWPKMAAESWAAWAALFLHQVPCPRWGVGWRPCGRECTRNRGVTPTARATGSASMGLATARSSSRARSVPRSTFPIMWHFPPYFSYWPSPASFSLWCVSMLNTCAWRRTPPCSEPVESPPKSSFTFLSFSLPSSEEPILLHR